MPQRWSLAAMGGSAAALNGFPSYNDSDNVSGTVATVAVTVDAPASPIANDIFLCFVQSSNQAIAVPTNSGAGTWVEITNSPQGIGTAASAGSVRLAVFWMRYTASVGTVTVADTGDHTIAQIQSYRGCLTSGNPWNATSGQTETATGTTATFPGLTTTIGNCLIVGVVANAADVLTSPQINFGSSSFGNLTADVGFTGTRTTVSQSGFGTTSSIGTGGGFDFFAGRLATAGSVGTITTVNNDSSANYAEMLIALTSN